MLGLCARDVLGGVHISRPFRCGGPARALLSGKPRNSFCGASDGCLCRCRPCGGLSADGKRVTMRQNAPDFGPEVDRALVADAIGLTASDIIALPQLVSTGLPFVITVLEDRTALSLAKLSASGVHKMHDALGLEGDAMEPFLCTLGGFTDIGDTAARLLMLPPSPPEDPFTGSATGAMASYLWHHGLIENTTFVAEQGHMLGRPGRADVRLIGSKDAIEGVEVAGTGHILMSGTLHL